MPFRLLNRKQAFETEPAQVKSLPVFGPQYRIAFGHRCRVDREKWAHRPYKEPFREDDFDLAAAGEEGVLEGLVNILREERGCKDDCYFEPGAKIVGVWGTGSGAAGRYTKGSDIDIWVQIIGLTHQGSKYADMDIVGWMENHDVTGYGGGQERKIDAVVVDYPPDPDACKYDMMQEEGVQEWVRRFNER